MFFVLIFVFELCILFVLSKKLTRSLYRLFYKLTKNKKVTVYLYALVFAPGTFIHEISHFLMALFLLVPVGQLEIIPEIQDDKIKLGSTPVAKTDPVRRAMVGFAPFLFGITLILVIVNFVVTSGYVDNTLYTLLAIYLIFEIGNTMFLSKKDLEGTWKLLLLISFLYGLFYLLGLRFSINPDSAFMGQLIETFKNASIFMLVPLGIDTVMVAILRLLKF